MNPRNLLPLNSLFFGVLVRTRGIRAWQVGLLLPGGLSFHPRRNLNWPPGPPLSFPLCNNPLFLQEALSNPACLGWLLGGIARGGCGCLSWVPKDVPSAVLLAKGAPSWAQVAMADHGWAPHARPGQHLPEHMHTRPYMHSHSLLPVHTSWSFCSLLM